MIDDHPVNRIVTATPLEQVGAAVDTAPSAMEGLKLIETHAYDLLLIDLHMPEMDGVQATELLRRHEAEGRCAHQDRLPVIAVSADVTEAARTACREVGMIGFIANSLRPSYAHSGGRRDARSGSNRDERHRRRR